jgi:3-hydroxybutyryl-CoA dehydrogenase
VRPRPPAIVAVIGAGTMGAGIALAFARAGSAVRLTARRESSLAAALARIESGLAVFVEGGATSAGDASLSLGRIASTTSFADAVAGATLVVESVIEDVDVKRDVLARAEAAAPGAILATDTSSISIGALAEGLQRPEAFAGLHWFNPPELVPLVEVISGEATAPETVERLLDWSRAAGKRPVHVQRDVEGFLANRLQYALFREAFALVESGVCGLAEVDEAVRSGLGARWAAVGPFESLDLAGLDIYEAVARRLYPTLSVASEPSTIATRLVEQGHLGGKTGRGLYGVYRTEDLERLVRRRATILTALEGMRDLPGDDDAL